MTAVAHRERRFGESGRALHIIPLGADGKPLYPDETARLNNPSRRPVQRREGRRLSECLWRWARPPAAVLRGGRFIADFLAMLAVFALGWAILVVTGGPT